MNFPICRHDRIGEQPSGDCVAPKLQLVSTLRNNSSILPVFVEPSAQRVNEDERSLLSLIFHLQPSAAGM